MDDFEAEIKNDFLNEAEELLNQAESASLGLSTRNDPEQLDRLMRLAHNFKGSAKAVGFAELSDFAHHVEDVLVKIRNNQLEASKHVVSCILQSLDALKTMVEGLRKDFGFKLDVTAITASLQAILAGQKVDAPAEGAAPPAQTESAAASAPEEMPEIVPKDAPAKVAEVKAKSVAPAAPGAPKKEAEEEAIRVSTRKLDTLLNLIGELVVNHSIMTAHRLNGSTNSPEALQTLVIMEKLVKEIQDNSMALRMVPVKPLFLKLQRTARNIATELGKEVIFETSGEHVELDKTILDRVTDPLTHLIRNAVDHGVENREDRIKSGKPLAATIRVEAIQQDEKFVLRVSDDGKGLDKERIQKKAIEKGLMKPGVELSDREIYYMVFQPGFSTKEAVTEISGRGVGMDVVMRTVEELKGDVEIDTVAGRGTSFAISLPLSLSIIDGMIVLVNDRKYVVPLSHLTEIVEHGKFRIETSTQKGKMVNLRGEVIPLLSLQKIIQFKDKTATPLENHAPYRTGLVVARLGKKVSFEVDRIIGRQSIVLKKLGHEFDGVPGVIAGAILSNGEPGLVLNLQELIQREVGRNAA